MPENQEAGRPHGELTFQKSTFPKEAGDQRLLHPAETFSWLPKEQYIKRSNEYVNYWAPIGEKALREDPNFHYQDNLEVVRVTSELFSRTLFISDYLRDHQTFDRSIPIHIHSDTQTVNSNVYASAVPNYYLHGELVPYYPEIAPEDVERVKLGEVRIFMNLNRLGDDISDIMDFVKQLKQQGEPERDVDAFYAERIDRLGIKQEQAMVEEMSHAIYFIDAEGKLESRKRLFEEFRQYPYLDDIDKRWTPVTPEVWEKYRSIGFEQDAEKWVAAFTHHYYPEIAEEAEEK